MIYFAYFHLIKKSMELCCKQHYRQQKTLAATKENSENYDRGIIHKFMSTYIQSIKNIDFAITLYTIVNDLHGT
jgi:hypothetical protein